MALASAVVGNLHAILMQNLLADAESLGRIRQTVVNIRDTTFLRHPGALAAAGNVRPHR